ncbi:hypothetical protein Taro_054938 [Colocasia esculenta]|uniref:Uncharacterized protein n=1 Tax=Colocasia esculenta TaxID=4460 RepID=A0A843XS30_COLES|nr:hypothetical protein [Colocasia esculenta]
MATQQPDAPPRAHTLTGNIAADCNTHSPTDNNSSTTLHPPGTSSRCQNANAQSNLLSYRHKKNMVQSKLYTAQGEHKNYSD